MLATHAALAAERGPLGRLDYAPYRVTVWVTFATDPAVTPALRRQTIESLRTRLCQTFGATWSVADGQDGVAESDAISPPDESGLERLAPADVARLLDGKPPEKAYLCAVRPRGPAWLVAGREWDRTVQSIGPIAAATTLDRRGLADALLQVLERTFTPLLVVDDADRDAKTASLTVRAGSIPFADSRFAPLKKGSLFQPVFRFLDAKGNARKVQPVPWTYLVLDDVKSGRATCLVASSYRAPLAANMRRGRVEAIAVPLNPQLPETALRLRVGRTASRPLGGIFVLLRPFRFDPAGKSAHAAGWKQLLSDRAGRVTVAFDPRQPLQLLEVHSGAAILARRPFLPGVDADVVIELPDDEIRLNTEREIDMLRGQLIETVARRAALIGRARTAVKKNDQPDARQSLVELEQLSTAETYLSKLNEIRVLALEEAHRRKDRVAEKRIEDLCQKTQGLIGQYLPDDRIQAVKEEIGLSLADSKVAAPRQKEASPPPDQRSRVRKRVRPVAPGAQPQ